MKLCIRFPNVTRKKFIMHFVIIFLKANFKAFNFFHFEFLNDSSDVKKNNKTTYSHTNSNVKTLNCHRTECFFFEKSKTKS